MTNYINRSRLWEEPEMDMATWREQRDEYWAQLDALAEMQCQGCGHTRDQHVAKAAVECFDRDGHRQKLTMPVCLACEAQCEFTESEGI